MGKPTLSPGDCQLLLTPNPPAETLGTALAIAGFAEKHTAWERLRRLARAADAPCDFVASLLTQLAATADPDRVLVNVERLATNTPNPANLLNTLTKNPRALEILVTVMASSQFLTEILLRTPAYFSQLVAHHNLSQVKTRTDFETRISAEIAPHPTAEARLDALRRFQRWQYLRIGTCDLLGLFDMPTVTEQLSRLADALVQTALHITAEHTGINPAGFSVLAMGKLGGEELNYSSDIDLLFISATADERYLKLGKRLIDALTRVTAEGFLYRVDMRLRPWGKVGALVTSVSAYLNYLHQHAQLWEKQALLKARTIAGDSALGGDFLNEIAPIIFAADGALIQTEVRAMKTRIESNLRKKGRGWGEVKLGAGSIRDIEFLTQYLQLAHGDTHPQVRSRNTLDGLTRLMTHGFLSTDEHRILSEGYTFLRSVEHWLQMMHFRQTHTLPTDAAALTALAQRLGFAGENAGTQLVDHYTRHTEAIRAVYRHRLFPEETPGTPKPDSPVVQRHLARLAPAYATTFAEPDIARHAALANKLQPNRPAEVEAQPLADNRWQVTVVAFDYLGELSLICGLFFAHGLDIHSGNVFTYRPPTETAPDRRRKIVDVFVVSPTAGQPIATDLWQQYAADLQSLLILLEAGKSAAAQGQLAERLAGLYRRAQIDSPRMYPIDIEIDNTGEPHRTVLRIDTVDTIGFLYELTNALALAGVHITRMSIGTAGKHVSDMLHITDARGKKIVDPQKLRELRAAIVLTKHFTHLLPRSPNPAAALMRFRQFLGQLFARPNWTEELVSLEEPKVLSALAQLLGVSNFLWTDFLRMQHENLFPVLRNSTELATRKTQADLRAELASRLAEASTAAERVRVLNAFKDREMFRIDMRHILRYITVSGQFSAELTDLAEVVVSAAFEMCRESLVARYGEPRLADGTPCAASVCALGKCGGRELGFASDIELMVIYAGKGHTDGAEHIPTAEFFERLAQCLPETIQAKREGIFEIDLRLRPYGKSGAMAVPLEAFRRYYAPDGEAWEYERQALVKLRPIVGDEAFGAEIVALRDKFVYTGVPFDVTAMRGMRERQVRHWVTPGTVNVKLSPGGLVDVEYLIQGLQITHGAENPYLRTTNTREAMTRLAEVGLLSPTDFEQLLAAHKFLRRLINALRMVHGNAKDLTVPPANSEEFAFLARRLHYGDDVSQLQTDLSAHMQHVQEINARLLT